MYTYVGKCNRKGLQDYIQTDNSYAIELRLEEVVQFIPICNVLMLCREKVFIYYLCNLKIILSLEIELIKRANMQNAKVYKEMAAELQPRGRKDSKRRPLV